MGFIDQFIFILGLTAMVEIQIFALGLLALGFE